MMESEERRRNESSEFSPGQAARGLRVLMTADAVGGVWNYALELARALQEHEIQIVLATMGEPPSDQQRAEAARIPNVTLCASRYKLEWMRDPWDDVRAAGEWLLELESRTQPDIIHLNGYAHGTLPWKAPSLIVGHSCVCSWFAAVKRQPAPKEWAEYRERVAQGLRAADLVTAPSWAMLNALRSEYGEFRAAQPIYNGRTPSPACSAGAKEVFVFTMGRLWDEAKNIAILNSVAPNIPWPIHAAGDDRGPEGERMRLQALVLLGRLDAASLADVLARAAIFVLPARYEPFGLSALEAALAGCTLVLGNIPSLHEIWGENALFVSPDDADEISAALQMLIRDSGLRESLAAKAYKRALYFTPKRVAEQYLSLYRNLLRPRTHRRSEVTKSNVGAQ